MPRIAIIPLPSPCKPWQGEQKILYRSSPRSSSSRLRGSGKTLESLDTANSSSSTEPRATVFSTNGRAERPSVKKSEGERGRFLGCCAISCLRLHPANKINEAATQAIAKRRAFDFVPEVLIIFHLVDVRGVESLQKAGGVLKVELRVARLDAQEEAFGGGVLDETVHIEERMMRAGEPIQRQHAKYGGERGAEHGEFKGDGNEGGPAVQRASANVERIGDDAYPILKEKATKTACQAADQGDEGHVVALQSKRFGEALNWKRRIRLDAAIAGLASFLHGVDKLVLGLELGHNPVNMGAMFHHS